MRRRNTILGLSRRAAIFCLVIIVAGTLTCCQQKRTATAPSRPSVTTPPSITAAGAPEIRVAILKNAGSAQISSKASARIISNNRTVRELPAGAAVRISQSGTGLAIDGAQVASPVKIDSSAALRLNDQEIARSLTVAQAHGGVLVIARLNLEEYLAGVLAGEVPYERWHIDAVKAQAVASRTYALNQIQKNAAELYDVESTVMSQVFKPGVQINPKLREAIGGTHGLALVFNNTIFPAYFHSTCGQHTAGCAGIFPDTQPIKPLSGASCGYCSASPSFRWRVAFDKETLAARLRANYAPARNLGKIESLEFRDALGRPFASTAQTSSNSAASTGPNDFSGARAAVVYIKHGGGTLSMPGNQFRLALGAKDLKSLLLSQVVDTGTDFEFVGGGFGHGVGMCQFGAEGIAAAGHPFTTILGTYYPGASLKRMY